MTVVAASEEQELRADGRTNLYLAANLRWPGGATAVRIRNLSARGALIEAAVLPLASTAVELVRGELCAGGAVAWNSGNKAGLRLAEIVSVREWMGATGSAAQQRVDGLVRAIRSGDLPSHHPRSLAELSVAAAMDLRLAAKLLEQLGDTLVADMALVASHGRELQSLDVVQQLLEALARADEGLAIDGARLADLRASAQAAMMR
ncbi:hypothetical protein OMW55_01045 [Sphingomonas sp. BN140010]|uniref:PilZ domain-containing protein n=1 Tax=Sphingomonas arvum TaxID=2992113 RepID=A0ABT3JBG1_9SPHN|nr:hypothetical protein [Sphingomonas sp. BN140010]MCW3796397.1 hypothetical protein [Sphingomonas sp. BN140010]